MDRLSAVIIAISLAACGTKDDKPVAAPSARTDGAKVAQPQAASTDAFCDLHATDATGPAFTWPELADGAAPAAAPSWRWVNLWATWCKPCIEEMPRVLAWRDKLAAAGKHVDLQFVSVDESAEDVAAFRKDHPGLLPASAPSIRIASASARAAWLKTFKLDDGAIPIQLFVSAANKLRCSRAGGVRDKDYAVVSQLLAE